MTDDAPRSVLFVCVRNAVRSPIAAGLVYAACGNRVHAASAGIAPGEPDSIAAAVMNEIGIDIAGDAPRGLDELDDTQFDLVVALAARARDDAEAKARATGAAFEFWPMPDTTAFEGSREMRLAAYRELRDRLMTRIKERLPAQEA